MIFSKYSTLQLALGASIAVHAVLLSVRFIDPESFNRVFEDTPMEVILVNARSNEKPDKAKAIAQASLAGGGDVEKGRATSPLPPSELTDVGDTLETASASRLQKMQEQQSVMLAILKQQIASLPPPARGHGVSCARATIDCAGPHSAARDERRRRCASHGARAAGRPGACCRGPNTTLVRSTPSCFIGVPQHGQR